MTFVEQAYEIIKQNIHENRYPPGHHILERQLAEDLGMSRTPIREALIRLSNEGLVEVIPRRGMRVIPLAASDMKEIYEVLTSLEVTAVELLARQEPDPETLAPLKAAVDEMDEALEKDDLDAWAAADARFHTHLISLCGNNRLAAMAATLSDQVHRARMVTLRLRPKPVQSNAEHRGLIEALEKGDAESAAKIHYEHRSRSSKTLLDILSYYRLAHL